MSDAGRVRFVKVANAAFDRYTAAPPQTERQWMRDHYWRMLAYAPYFDARVAWYPDAWVYQDLYAIYADGTLADAHPDWILRDGAGAPLFIPWGCGGGTCPQYAGDPGNPAFRAWWIAQATARVAPGYRGLFVDDVNLAPTVSDGTGQTVAPVDPRTGAAMTAEDWRRYVAEFAEAIRAALPDAEIVHNQVWFAAPASDPSAARALAAADLIDVERGFLDGGLRGGGGRYGFDTLAAWVDALHAAGKGAIFESSSATAGREYALATYFLVASGRDGLAHGSESFPDDWWPGWDVSLGAAAGPRYAWSGLVRRDFARGSVLVNPPDEPTRTVDLGRTYRGIDGGPVARVVLDAAQGAVLLLPSSLSAPAGRTTPRPSTSRRP